MPFTEHGFVGMEAKTIKAILSWIRDGTVPGDISDWELTHWGAGTRCQCGSMLGPGR